MKEALIKVFFEILVLCFLFGIIYYFLRRRIIKKTIKQIDSLLEQLINESKNKEIRDKVQFFKSDISGNYEEMKLYFTKRSEYISNKHPQLMEQIRSVLEI